MSNLEKPASEAKDDLAPVPVAIKAALGFRPAEPTWRRWVRSGVRGNGTGRIRLEAMKIAGRLYSRPSWVLEFAEATNHQVTSGAQSTVGVSRWESELAASQYLTAEFSAVATTTEGLR